MLKFYFLLENIHELKPLISSIEDNYYYYYGMVMKKKEIKMVEK